MRRHDCCFAARPDALPIAVAPARLGEGERLRFSRVLPVFVLAQF